MARAGKLTEAKRRELLEAMAQDESLKATQRLRALEELGRMEARANGAAADVPDEDELPPDPMADLDELEARRRKRRRKAAAV